MSKINISLDLNSLKKITTALHCNAGELLDNRLTMMITSPISVKDGVLFLENSYFDSKFGIGDIYNLLDDIHKKEIFRSYFKAMWRRNKGGQIFSNQIFSNQINGTIY